MPKTTTTLEVFVSCPSDLMEERKLLEEVVTEFNLISSVDNSVRLQLLAWETHTHPGVGDDAQDVINQQIGDDYDIFIGMMWGRFGSPTGRSNSGTQEEFERAFARYRSTNGAVQIMFYFKDAPIPPSQIEPRQLESVQLFKQQLSQDYGALYHQFGTAEDFRKLIRIHLARLVQERMRALPFAAVQNRARDAPSAPSPDALSNFDALIDDNEDEGLIELSDGAIAAVQKAGEITEHINVSLTELGNRIRERAKEFEDLKRRNLLPDNKAIKRIADGAAQDMELYVQRMRVDLPAINAEYSTAMEKFGRMAMLSATEFNEPIEDIEKLLETFQQSRSTMADTKRFVEGMRDAMAQTPRMTTAYNRARKRAVAITEDFIAFLETADSQTGEVESVVHGIVENRRRNS